MAATTLTEASQDEIVSIFKAISNKVQGSVEGLVKTTQPKLNKLVAETIDSFRDNPRQVNKQMNLLADRMKELGFSVDDLTAGIDALFSSKVCSSVRSVIPIMYFIVKVCCGRLRREQGPR